MAAPTTAYDARERCWRRPRPSITTRRKPVPTPKPLFFDVRGHPVSTPAAVTTATAMPTVMYDAAGHPTATPTPPSVEPVAHDSAGPVPTPTPTAVTKKKEKESLPGHHHEHFDHEYPGTEGCEAICEGHGFGEEECNAMFFCEFADGRCYSALGPNPCPNTEAELKDAWKDFDTDYETTSNATLESFFPTRRTKTFTTPCTNIPPSRGTGWGTRERRDARRRARVSTSTNKRAPACFTACGMGAGVTAAWAQTRVRSRSRRCATRWRTSARFRNVRNVSSERERAARFVEAMYRSQPA